MIADWALTAALAVTLPGMAAWLLARRYGLAGIMGALAICAVLAIGGWISTRTVLTDEAQLRRSAIIFYVIVPGLVSLILGAIAGFWAALDNRR
ncbi:MAG TPA: hypothetical protein PLL33_14515 [Paracoccus sp. (in: a-proteobacteria)]|nr:hypothetical protein [Paracoccus sp. (in: a-proteobacteria)]